MGVGVGVPPALGPAGLRAGLVAVLVAPGDATRVAVPEAGAPDAPEGAVLPEGAVVPGVAEPGVGVAGAAGARRRQAAMTTMSSVAGS